MEKEHTLKIYVISRAFDLLRELVKASVWLGCAYFAWQATAVLAGRQTNADLNFSAFLAVDDDKGLPWVIAILMAGWAYLERRLRLNKTAQLQSHIKQLELRLDPNRTSSGLLPTGETNPEDVV